MKTVDISIKNMALLQNMIGNTFEKYRCDPFVFSPSVYGIVGLYIGDKIYKITSLVQPTERFFTKDDVAVFMIESSEDDEIVTMMDDGEMIDTPVRDTIISIDIINDHEIVCYENEKREFVSTKGIIFHLEGGNEISFEIGTWFSEMITIKRGYDLISQFSPQEEFMEEWDDCEGYSPEWSREIVTLNKR